jgi:uncharacterized protein YndB with AHSA1/START domain
VLLGATVAAGLVVVALGVLAASALADTPSKTVESAAVIDAPRADVWSTLVDVASYAEWNPAIVRAEGRVAIGSALELHYDDGESTEVEVFDVKELRKLRWRDRLVLPGVRDRELTIRVRDAAGGATRVVVVQRVEGLGAPFYDTDSDAERMERMLVALGTRVSDRDL